MHFFLQQKKGENGNGHIQHRSSLKNEMRFESIWHRLDVSFPLPSLPFLCSRKYTDSHITVPGKAWRGMGEHTGLGFRQVGFCCRGSPFQRGFPLGKWEDTPNNWESQDSSREPLPKDSRSSVSRCYCPEPVTLQAHKFGPCLPVGYGLNCFPRSKKKETLES